MWYLWRFHTWACSPFKFNLDLNRESIVKMGTFAYSFAAPFVNHSFRSFNSLYHETLCDSHFYREQLHSHAQLSFVPSIDYYYKSIWLPIYALFDFLSKWWHTQEICVILLLSVHYDLPVYLSYDTYTLYGGAAIRLACEWTNIVSMYF